MVNAWPILWWIVVVAAVAGWVWWCRRKGADDEIRDVDDADDAQPDDHRSPCDPAGGLTASHRPDLLVPAAAENHPADMGAQPGVGGILTSVTDLGAEWTPSEARTNRIFDRLEIRIRSIIMGAADDAVKGAVEQLNKARAEVLAQDASQEADRVSPETVASLKQAAQAFDDLNPDAPAGGGEESPGDVGTGGDSGGDTGTDTGGNPDGETDSSE